MITALLFSAATFGSTMIGGLVALRWPGRIEWLMAVAGGVVLGAALFDLLPEAVEHAQELGIDPRVPLGMVLAGYLLFNSVERWAHRHEEGESGGGHAHHHGEPSAAGLVGAAGFVAHSFFDGLAIGIGFRIDSSVGVLVALAVIGHDFSDGLNTVSILQAARHPASSARRWLTAVSIAPLLGALLASVAPVPEEVLPPLLGLFCGLFIYAASTHLLPAAHRLPALGSLAATGAGASVMLAISQFAGH